jgi:membrane-associated phospholipid phosphatase
MPAALLWPSVVSLLLVRLAAAVAWLRLALHRHTRADVIAGVLVGGAAGLGYHAIVG